MTAYMDVNLYIMVVFINQKETVTMKIAILVKQTIVF